MSDYIYIYLDLPIFISTSMSANAEEQPFYISAGKTADSPRKNTDVEWFSATICGFYATGCGEYARSFFTPTALRKKTLV